MTEFVLIVLYAAVGLGLGVYWDVVKRINTIGNKLLEIRKSNKEESC